MGGRAHTKGARAEAQRGEPRCHGGACVAWRCWSLEREGGCIMRCTPLRVDLAPRAGRIWSLGGENFASVKLIPGLSARG